MTSAAETLTQLAQEAQFELSDAEIKLLTHVAHDEEADFSADDDSLNDVAQATAWGDDRTIRAPIISWLCRDQKARQFITREGLRITGAKISDAINLESAELNFSLELKRCFFEEVILLEDATLNQLDLSGSYLSGGERKCDQDSPTLITLDASNIHVKNSILLREGFRSEGEIWLPKASIGQNLDCTDGEFNSTSGNAIIAVYANISGNLRLRDGFRSTGTIYLLAANIGGSLSCDSASFEKENGIALEAAQITIKGFLSSKGFISRGEIDLSYSNVGSILFEGATFLNRNGIAIGATGINTNVFALEHTTALGSINIIGSQINEFVCSGEFNNPVKLRNSKNQTEYTAINLSGSKINEYARFGSIKAGDISTVGSLSLSGCHVGTDLTIHGTIRGKKGDVAIQATNLVVNRDLVISESSRISGSVVLEHASIGNSLGISGKLMHVGKGSLLADHIKVSKNAILTDLASTGAILLREASIGGYLKLSEVTLRSQESHVMRQSKLDAAAGHEVEFYSVSAEGANITKGIRIFNSKFSGTFEILRAILGDSLICRETTFESRYEALEAESMQVQNDVFLYKCKMAGRLSFYAAKIEKQLILEDLDESSELSCDLRYATVGILRDEEKSWPRPGRLSLEGFTYGKIHQHSPRDANARLRWLRLQYSEYPRTLKERLKWEWTNSYYESFSPQPYKQLAAVLQSHGQVKDATEVLVAQKEDLRILGRLSWLDDYWNSLLGLTIAHGYKPYRALIIAFGFVLFGSVAFHRGYTRQPSEITPSRVSAFVDSSPDPTQTVQEQYPRFNAFMYSLDVFVPIVDFQQRAYWLPNANRGDEDIIPIIMFKYKQGALLRWYFWIHTIAGWVLTSLWVAGFTGLVRRID